MVQLVGFILRLLLLCAIFAFTHGNQHKLKGTKKDDCFKSSQKETAECLQKLIESYYGKSFTRYCPEFPQILAESKCRGCPWDELDPKNMNPNIADEYRKADNESFLFHPPRPGCTISEHVKEFNTLENVSLYVSGSTLLGSFPVLFATGAIVQYTSDYNGLTRPSFCGARVHEWVFLGAVWISFNVGKIFLLLSEKFYLYCDFTASNLSLVITRYLGYVLLVYYSLRRCRRLRFPQTEPQTQLHITTPRSFRLLTSSIEAQANQDSSMSWHTFLWRKERGPRKKHIRMRKIFVFLVLYGSSAFVLFFCVADFIASRLYFSIHQRKYICKPTEADRPARFITILKLTLEPLVYVVYSFGASTRNKVALYIRYFALALIAIACVTIIVLLCSNKVDVLNGLTLLYRKIPLEGLQLAELIHIITVSIYGLFEPLKYGSIYLGKE